MDTIQGDQRCACKPDWPAAKARWRAFWDMAATDRPCLDLRAFLPDKGEPPPIPPTLEGRWLDPDYLTAFAVHNVASMYFGGEAVPTNPVILAGWTLGCGPDVRFAETTIYHPVTTSSLDEPVRWWPGPADPWRAKLERVYDRLLEAAKGRFLVGYPFQVPVNDLLMLFRGNADFLTDLAERPELCTQRLREMLPAWFADQEHFFAMIDAQQDGCVWAWPGLWSDEFVMETQSDMSCMISSDLFERYVMVELDAVGERYERVWYHLDGPQAVRHLPTLLSRPYVKVIQYVPGSGAAENGPAWLDLYRQVQAAGRGLDLYVSLGTMEFLIRHLRPEGLVLRCGVHSPEEAQDWIDKAPRLAGRDIGKGK
ncbi:MAG: hypothetical protein GXY33_22305 [Phycisphaerae bacterium]|nr:hypothetical protein [Phycisphaerae bacterium]